MPSSDHKITQGSPGPAPRRSATRSRGSVLVGEIIAIAARPARRDWRRILMVAMTVAMVTVGVEITVDHLIDPRNLPLSLLAQISTAALSILGTVLVSGFLTRLVGAAGHGAPDGARDAADRAQPVSLREVAGQLPWSRLVRADLLVVLIVVIGVLLLVIPGLVALTWLAVTGPVIEIEHRKVLAALRRSARLVRPHFWAVALLATVPVLVAGELDSVAAEPTGARQILEVLAVRGLAEGLLEAAIGLILVALCYRLIALDAEPPPGDR